MAEAGPQAIGPRSTGAAGLEAAGAVFISHSSRDRKVAHTLCTALEHRGLRCWISSRDIGPGENFQEAIVRAIRQAKVMVLVFTGNANNSNEIKKELALASQCLLAVIPVRVEDVVPDDAFTYEFATRQWIDTFDNWEHAIERLAQQIGLLLRIEPVAGAPVLPPPRRRATPIIGGIAAALVIVAGAWLALEHYRPSASGSSSAVAPTANPSAATAPPATPPAANPLPSNAAEHADKPSPAGEPFYPGGELVFQGYQALQRSDFAAAMRLFGQAAELGNPNAQRGLGFIYQRGLGVPVDFAEAMRWYRKSADQGFSAGIVGIATLYHFGQGVPADYDQAMKLYRQAADKDNAFGMFGVAQLYQTGRGVPKDPVEAVRWFHLAADKNAPPAMFQLGLHYEHGVGVPKDLRQARQWMQKAADAGVPEAQAWLASNPEGGH